MKKKERKGRWLLKLAAAFLCTCILCMAGLFLASGIPKAYIQAGSERSAQYFMEHELFPCLKKGKINTKYDNYADCMLFHIAYQIDGENPFPAMVKAVYYDDPWGRADDNYYASVFEGKRANTTYFRYWHGAICLIRPLLCIWGVVGIRKALYACLVLLNIALGVLLWKKGQKDLLILYFLSLWAVKIWVVAFSVEYVMAFILMSVMTICFVACEKSEDGKILWLSVISGVLTCFFDFLTVETITITVPLLFLIGIKQSEGRLRPWKKELGFVAAAGFLWGASYMGMFLLKWLISAKMMGSRVFREVADTAGYRIDHGAGGQILLRLSRGVIYNVSALSGNGMVSGLIIGVCAAAILVLFWKGGTFCRILLCLGMVPYFRFLALSAHSIEHCFFTYRAQLATIMAFGMIVLHKGKTILKERKGI